MAVNKSNSDGKYWQMVSISARDSKDIVLGLMTLTTDNVKCDIQYLENQKSRSWDKPSHKLSENTGEAHNKHRACT